MKTLSYFEKINFRIILFIGVLIGAVLACGDGFGAIVDIRVKEKPQVKDVVGVYWYPNGKTGESGDSKIELFEDGSCELTNFPVFHINDKKYLELENFYSGDCHWETLMMGDNQLDDTSASWGICLSSEGDIGEMRCAQLLYEGNPYNLDFVSGYDYSAFDNMRFSSSASK